MVRRRHEFQQRVFGVAPETVEVIDVQGIYPMRHVSNIGQNEAIGLVGKDILGSHPLICTDEGWLSNSHDYPADALAGRE
jgi:hypothetical protein